MVDLYEDIDKLGEVLQLLGKRNEDDTFMAYRSISELLKKKAKVVQEYERQIDAEYAIIEAGRGEGQVV